MLVGISEYLLDGGRARAARAEDPFPVQVQHKVRTLQRAYVQIWVDTLRRLTPGLSAEAARIAALSDPELAGRQS